MIVILIVIISDEICRVMSGNATSISCQMNSSQTRETSKKEFIRKTERHKKDEITKCKYYLETLRKKGKESKREMGKKVREREKEGERKGGGG